MNDYTKMDGIIHCNDAGLMFYLDRYDVTIFPKELQKTGQTYRIHTNDEFIHGTAHSGNRIAFYTGTSINKVDLSKDFTFRTRMLLKTEMANPTIDICPFHNITFVGGSLNLLAKNDLPFPKYNENEDMIVSIPTERKEYRFKTKEGSCIMSIGELSEDSWGKYKGEITKKVFVSLEFEKEQSLASIFAHYENVNRLVSIMTYRSINRFDSIYVMPGMETKDRFTKKVLVYIDKNPDAVQDPHSVVTFDDLKESAANLLQLFYLSEDNKPSYSLGFIPKDDRDYRVITDDKVRSICSAIECELAFNKELEQSQSEALDDLCAHVKETVKDYRRNNEASKSLSEGTYAMIFGSIDHWSMSAFERTRLLYQKFAESLTAYYWGSPKVCDDDIRAFIKYRNGITHGSFKVMSDAVIRASSALAVLAICSLLHRSGVQMDNVVRLSAFQICR